jgi:hypothetical protein
MKRFIRNSVLLVIPFAAYMVIIFIVDPFNYLNLSGRGDREVREDISQQVEPHLFRIIEFENHPRNNIVLGDSRSNGLFSKINSDQWSNLAYGGGSLQEMIETFWWTVEVTEIDTVIMGLNLNLYNRYNKRFWVKETLERRKNFFSYAFTRYTFQATFLILKSYVTTEKVRLDKPQASKEEFWQFIVKERATKFYEQFGYPDEYYKELKKISEYCSANTIKLIFWIPPTHTDFQKRKTDFRLDMLDERFVSDLKTLGELYDFDYPSELTSDMDDYRDPMHFDVRVGEIVHDEIFLRSPHYARFSAINYSVNTGDKNTK